MPTVILLGGSGQIGVFVVPRLLQAGYRVVAVVRKRATQTHMNKPGPENLLRVEIQQLTAELVGSGGAGSLLLSCGPIELARQVLQRQVHFKRAVIISTSSVTIKKDSTDAREREQMETIFGAEKAIKRLCRSNGTSLVLLRPTLIYGCGMDYNVSLIYRWMKKWRFFPVAAKAPGLRQPLHADDLAEVALGALSVPVEDFLESPVCGGSTISYREMVDRTGQAAGNGGRGVALPSSVLAVAVAVAGRLSPARRMGAGMVWRQAEDLVFNDHEIRLMTEVSARKFRPQSLDFQRPSPIL